MTGQFPSIMTGFPATSGSHRDSRTVLSRRFTCSHWCYPDFQIECIPCRNPEG